MVLDYVLSPTKGPRFRSHVLEKVLGLGPRSSKIS